MSIIYDKMDISSPKISNPLPPIQRALKQKGRQLPTDQKAPTQSADHSFRRPRTNRIVPKGTRHLTKWAGSLTNGWICGWWGPHSGRRRIGLTVYSVCLENIREVLWYGIIELDTFVQYIGSPFRIETLPLQFSY